MSTPSPVRLVRNRNHALTYLRLVSVRAVGFMSLFTVGSVGIINGAYRMALVRSPARPPGLQTRVAGADTFSPLLACCAGLQTAFSFATSFHAYRARSNCATRDWRCGRPGGWGTRYPEDATFLNPKRRPERSCCTLPGVRTLCMCVGRRFCRGLSIGESIGRSETGRLPLYVCKKGLQPCIDLQPSLRASSRCSQTWSPCGTCARS